MATSREHRFVPAAGLDLEGKLAVRLGNGMKSFGDLYTCTEAPHFGREIHAPVGASYQMNIRLRQNVSHHTLLSAVTLLDKIKGCRNSSQT